MVRWIFAARDRVLAILIIFTIGRAHAGGNVLALSFRPLTLIHSYVRFCLPFHLRHAIHPRNRKRLVSAGLDHVLREPYWSDGGIRYRFVVENALNRKEKLNSGQFGPRPPKGTQPVGLFGKKCWLPRFAAFALLE